MQNHKNKEICLVEFWKSWFPEFLSFFLTFQENGSCNLSQIGKEIFLDFSWFFPNWIWIEVSYRSCFYIILNRLKWFFVEMKLNSDFANAAEYTVSLLFLIPFA
jgi:hypothetical protein